MKRQTWLRHRIPTNTRAPLAAYTCLILGQISPHGGIMWRRRNDSFNHGDGNHQKSYLLSGCLRPPAARSTSFRLDSSELDAALHRAAAEPMSSENARGERGRNANPRVLLGWRRFHVGHAGVQRCVVRLPRRGRRKPDKDHPRIEQVNSIFNTAFEAAISGRHRADLPDASGRQRYDSEESFLATEVAALPVSLSRRTVRCSANASRSSVDCSVIFTASRLSCARVEIERLPIP